MIIEYENFLTADECQSLIGFGESSNLSLGTTGGVKIGYRKAKVNWLDENEVVTKIKVGVARLSGVDIDKQERLHFVRYVNLDEDWKSAPYLSNSFFLVYTISLGLTMVILRPFDYKF